tara:strand:+ start:95 stop:268 length:174 start_codon:yes stop_codon:yes gene_type:complete
MRYDQALKFLGKRVFVVNDDTSITHGILEKVEHNSATIRTLKDNTLSVYLRFIFPLK